MMAPSFLAGLYLSAGKEVSQKACGGEFYSFPLVSSVNEFRRMELELSAVGTKKAAGRIVTTLATSGQQLACVR